MVSVDVKALFVRYDIVYCSVKHHRRENSYTIVSLRPYLYVLLLSIIINLFSKSQCDSRCQGSFGPCRQSATIQLWSTQSHHIPLEAAHRLSLIFPSQETSRRYKRGHKEHMHTLPPSARLLRGNYLKTAKSRRPSEAIKAAVDCTQDYCTSISSSNLT